MSSLQQLEEYIESQPALEFKKFSSGLWQITQKIDKKSMTFDPTTIKELMIRIDPEENKPFFQINLKDKRKFLITSHFVGFKPLVSDPHVASHLPQVVTTVDLLTISEAIEELLTSESHQILVELDILKKAYLAITLGAQEIGFDMSQERSWILSQLSINPINAA